MVDTVSNFTFISYPGYIYLSGSDGNVYCVSATFACYADPDLWYDFTTPPTRKESTKYLGTNIIGVVTGNALVQVYFSRPTAACDRTFSFSYIGSKICNGKNVSNVDVVPPTLSDTQEYVRLRLSANGCVKTGPSCSSNSIPNPGVSLVPYYFNDGDEVQEGIPGYALLMDNQTLPLMGLEGLEHFASMDNIGLSGLENFA